MVCLDCLELSQSCAPHHTTSPTVGSSIFAAYAADPGLCRVKDRPQQFKFTVESNGALKPEDIVQRGIQVLKRKLNQVRLHLTESQAELD